MLPLPFRADGTGRRFGEPAVDDVPAVTREAGVIPHEQQGRAVLREDLTQVGHHHRRGVAEQVEHAHQTGPGEAGHTVGGRGPVTGQMEQVGALVVREAQRTGQRGEQLGRGLTAAALLQADHVVDRHAGEHRHLFPAQSAGATPGSVGDADLGGTDRLAAAAQEVGELLTFHAPMLPRGAAPIQGAALP